MSVRTWGDFEIDFDRVLGKGGMGAVYRGRQVSLDRPAAIKVLKKDLTESAEFVKRFQREAALLARLVDANVVQVFGAGQGDGEYFYAMEFVEGEELSARLRAGYKFTIDEVLQVALQVGRALQAAWKHRIVHRDIKPSNIILTRDGPIKVMDFGLAKNTDSDLTQSEVIMGTAKYMSPEQATSGAVDVRSDLYSLGAVLYELATGQPPFTGQSPTAVIYQHVHQPPRDPREINPSIPEEVQALILRLLAKDPKNRVATPEALVSTVQGILEGVTPDERSTLFNETLLLGTPDESSGFPGGGEASPPPARSSALPLALCLMAAVLVLGVGGYFLLDVLKTPSAFGPDFRPPPVVRLPEGDGEKPSPPPAPPPTAKAWEEPLRKGIEAFGERKWELASALLEEAQAKGAPREEVEEKANRARAYERVTKGDEAKEDDEKALEYYEAALKFLPRDEEIQRKVQRARHARWSAGAARSERGGDWARAAADWGRAAE
jgi:serine/threonine-protein kinase